MKHTKTKKARANRLFEWPILLGLAVLFITIAIVAVVQSVNASNVVATGEIRGLASKCLDNNANRLQNSNKIQLYGCNSTAAQRWALHDDGSLRLGGNFCLDVRGASKVSGAIVQLYRCNGTPAQKWQARTDGSVVNPNSGMCLDVRSGQSANGTQIQIYRCNGTAAQKWTLPKAATPPPVANTCLSNGKGGAFSDRTYQSHSGAGKSGQYHVYAGGMPTNKPVGIIVQLHGDAAWEFSRPTSGKLASMAAHADTYDMILVSVKAPDTSGVVTWWEEGASNAAWLQTLLNEQVYARYNIDKSKVWFAGYSGGAQFITQYYTPKYNSTFCGGGAVIAGGGGANSRLPGTISASSNFKKNFKMHWYTGQEDTAANAEDKFCGICAARTGAEYYKNQGFTATSTQFPAGVNHYQLDEPGVLRAQLSRAYGF
ncbi:ricin-type beta-trefoil lectin domain protein [Candidatus Saccharibacteria bacterium]|nr:ricin-type beta-trefoil lectin domain protein [Candidatus Saccharibacteria bacterium]